MKNITVAYLIDYLKDQTDIPLHEVFTKNDIDGTVLYYTKQDELQSLGMTIGNAKLITIFIEKLKKKEII